MRVYIDTNVIMDFFLNRRSSSLELFKNTLRCLHTIVISDVVLSEPEYQQINVASLISILKSSNKIDIVYVNNSEKFHAKQLRRMHYNDTLHYLLAKRSGVDCLVTNNLKDFPFTDLCIKSPDNI
jgi:predicted nucleic acid-binding protein